MSLIKCPECGAMISDRAEACPHCGCPRHDFEKVRAANGDSAGSKNEPIQEKNIEETKSLTSVDPVKGENTANVVDGKSKSSTKNNSHTVILGLFVFVVGLFITIMIVNMISPEHKTDLYSDNDTTWNVSGPAALSQSEETATSEVNSEDNANKSNWSYDQNLDELTGKTSYFAQVTSDNSVDFDFPYNSQPIHLTLTVRKSPRYGTDVYISVPEGQFNAGIDGATISVRFDDGKVKRYSCNTPSDNSTNTLFINSARSFIKSLKASKECRISAEFYQEGTPTFIFQTDGLVWNH